jgi:uncharacterized integral membrane protein
MKKTFSLILIAMLIILVVVFTLQNSDSVLIKFFYLGFSSSLSLIIFLTFVVGGVVAIIALSPSMIKESKSNKSMRKRIKQLESQIEKYLENEKIRKDKKQDLLETGRNEGDKSSDNLYYKQ